MAPFFEVNNIADEKKVSWLLNVMEAKTYSLLRTLVALLQPKEKTMEELVPVLKLHYEPKRLIITRWFYFHRRDQAAQETIAEHIAELCKLATPCEFGQYLDQALRDRLVCGLRSETTQKQLLSEADLSLTKAVTIAQGMEAAEFEAKSLQGEKTTVNNVKTTLSSTAYKECTTVKIFPWISTLLWEVYS